MGKKGKLTFVVKLVRAIEAYKRMAIAESWSGGGDPADIPEIKAKLELRRVQLNRLLDRVQEKEE